MYSRRDFLTAAAALGSSSVAWGNLPDAITRAFAINPEAGTTYMDAEHVVILMQENRSFDHAFGSLRGVRGFRDPRAHRLPDGSPVWLQPSKEGKIVPPFRMDMDGTNVTWIGGTPHSWPDQVDARNGGRYDNWLQAKRRGDGYPMTMGYFTRADLPFYYALADAFTVCDQAFCSSLTGTTPNRLHLWTGTIRESAKHPARVMNGDTDYDAEAAWTTFPERLEDAGVSWKIYQNEVSIDSGLQGEHDAWLANFTDNPIEWFTQYGVRHSKTRRAHVARLIERAEKRLADIKSSIASATADEKPKLESELGRVGKQLDEMKQERAGYTDDSWRDLPQRSKNLHERAFADNRVDPGYRDLVDHSYDDNGTARRLKVPKGDVLAQFRRDVESKQLPAVSWLVAPERFSDHPGSAWFGAWYLSEAINILTADPEVWKKTVFILCYDENDGFFDHVPPFIAPHPGRPETGATSAGVDTTLEISKEHGRDHSIGLGYRCPMVVVSPWSRGGCVNSQVFDHGPSIIMFIEGWLAGKGKAVKETNINPWRRAVCGDLTSVFKPFNGESYPVPDFVKYDANVERIHKASFKGKPKAVAPISPAEASKIDIALFQERGTRPSCPLPYELEASVEPVEGGVRITMQAGVRVHRAKSAGGVFNVYSYGASFQARAYAVRPGDAVSDVLPTSGLIDVRIDGPNGFMRALQTKDQTTFVARVTSRGTSLDLHLSSKSAVRLNLKDESYGQKPPAVQLAAGEERTVQVKLDPTHRWYDLTVTDGVTTYRFAGRVETGQWSVSDPAMA